MFSHLSQKEFLYDDDDKDDNDDNGDNDDNYGNEDNDDNDDEDDDIVDNPTIGPFETMEASKFGRKPFVLETRDSTIHKARVSQHTVEQIVGCWKSSSALQLHPKKV